LVEDSPCGKVRITEFILNPARILVKMAWVVVELVPAGHIIVLTGTEKGTLLLKQLQGFNVLAGGQALLIDDPIH